ncbi:MAG: hypothetical protein GXP31_11455 [Kiritimatiellaeota bacterium]|nr:hypothetical protein [Kiritimatiellota bacterium]
MRTILTLGASLVLALAVEAGPAVRLRVPAAVPGPVRFGLKDLRTALVDRGCRLIAVGEAGNAFEIVVRQSGSVSGSPVPAEPESFSIVPGSPGDRRLEVSGRDPTGLMYGLLELAERVRRGTALEQVPKIVQAPFLAFRAPNPFLSLPYPFKGKWEDWWFRSEDFWRTYLDMLARARFNWVDLHGMYDVRTTRFPNIYPYFLTSKSFPKAGIAPAERAANLAMLKQVVTMAADRGIKVALMSYHASWNVRGAPRAPYPETEENLARYTRECVAELLRQVPNLGMVGFRIGESGRKEDFYEKSYLPGIADSGKDLPLYTRTWGASRDKILDLGRLYPERFLIEIKYNGEHFGLPYIVSGGRMARWSHYSYQAYCQPPEPYRIVWQIRANGTHRLFRWGRPAWVSRAVRACVLDGAVGFSLESVNSYYPQYDYYHKQPDLKWFKWVVERDWFWYLLWGRLAYDPNLPEDTWRAALAEHFGSADAGGPMLELSRNMSRIVPLIYSVHCMGPDHRNMAPEFETGGPIDRFAFVKPLDTFAMQSIPEYVARLLRKDPSARTDPLQMAAALDQAVTKIGTGLKRPPPRVTRGRRELMDWRADAQCLAALGAYYAAKVRAATWLQLYRATRDPESWRRARECAEQAVDAWQALSQAGDRFYRPFVDTLRMHTEKFRWSAYLPEVKKDLEILERVKRRVAALKLPVIPGVKPVSLAPLTVRVDCTPISATRALKTFRVRVTPAVGAVSFPAGTRAFLRFKHLPSEQTWRKRRMQPRDGGFVGTVRVTPAGAQWAVEVVAPQAGTCWPDWRRERPYRVIEPWDGPVPNLTPVSRLPELGGAFDVSRRRFGAILCGRIARALSEAPSAQKRELLAQVAAGQALVIFNQDYPGSFDASWLPGGIRGTDRDFDSCKTLGPHPLLDGVPATLQLKKIVNDALEGGDGEWRKLTVPCGLAVRRYGKGRIILVQLRLLETADDPTSERLLRNILRYALQGSDKPLLVLDSGNGALPSALDSLGIDYRVRQDGLP